MQRSNLRVLTDAHVERIIMRDGWASSVQFSRGGDSLEVKARQEIILCAGAIGTPHLLQLSGIGDGGLLRDAGLESQLHLPGVGRNLQDHLQLRAVYQVSGIRTMNEMYHSLPQRMWMGVDYALRRKGPLTMAPSQLGIFMRSDRDQQRANIQFHVQPLSLEKFGDPLHRFGAITASACNLRPTSRGTVVATSPDSREPPVISPRYLDTDDDRRVAVDTLRVTRRLMNQKPLTPYSPKEYLPGSLVDNSFASLLRAAGDIGTTIFHPVGTAKMGPCSDRTSVVDERLRLRGVRGLRIIDASVMPTITSGNTNTPTAMIADKGAKMVLADLER